MVLPFVNGLLRSFTYTYSYTYTHVYKYTNIYIYTYVDDKNVYIEIYIFYLLSNLLTYKLGIPALLRLLNINYIHRLRALEQFYRETKFSLLKSTHST